MNVSALLHYPLLLIVQIITQNSYTHMLTLLFLISIPLHTLLPLLENPLFSSLLFNFFCFKILFRHHLLWEAVSEVSQVY